MPFYSYPRIPGHELGVEVVAVGAGVSDVSAGERCAIEPYLNCGHCAACRGGHSNCCEQLEVLGVHTDGGMRPEFIVPARKLHPSATLGFEPLALVETLAIGCHAVSRGNPQPNETVLVIGAGPIGLATIEFVKLSGARCVVLDLNAQRLEFCRARMGIPDIVLGRGDASDADAVRSLGGGAWPQVVIDATGNHASMSNALEFVAFAGRLVFVGITSQEIRVRHPLMHRREMTLLASRNALPADFRRIIQLIEQGRLDTRPWLTHAAEFDELIGVFPAWLRPETGVIKAMVRIP
jgi:alcohol dehydrogenase